MNDIVKKKYEEWLNSDILSEEDKQELRDIDEKEIEERFYKDLDFGTGGLRGIRGIGTNRINRYMIGKATQGLANYMLKADPEAKKKGIAIAYDSRIMSTEFALSTALVMAANGIKAYLYDDLRPVPYLSFAVRDLNTLAGVVVTASHNPPEYNGYKVYWEDGAQVVAPHDKSIIEEVNKITDLSQIKYMTEDEALKSGLLVYIGKEIDDKYIEAIKKQQIRTDLDESKKELKLVYTPLNGSGNIPVRRILKEIGFENVLVVKEEEAPDGNFPTVDYPNPEAPDVFVLGQKLADENGADLVMGTDPDADRIGISIKNEKGEWIYPNGNQVGVLLTNYILENKKDIPKNGAIVSTVVSTSMLDEVAKQNNVKLYRTLTGFKFIGEKIKQFEKGELDNEYLFGFEESYGYLAGTHARDKDAVIATMLIAEMAAYFKKIGSSIEKEIERLYEKYGYYREQNIAKTFKGKSGEEKMQAIMTSLREDAPKEIIGKKVIINRDFQKSKEVDLVNNITTDVTLPKSNVIQFILEDYTYITVRPSGTEPKIKFYFIIKDETSEKADQKLETTVNEFLKTIE